MNSFSISQLARFSGIKSHTIRAWERRYSALEPGRSEGNTRFYSGDQLRRLLNLVSLLSEDGKLAELSPLSDAELSMRVKEKLEQTRTGKEYLVTQLIKAGLDFDEEGFNRILHSGMRQAGVSGAYTSLVYPCLHRLGLMWSAQMVSPAHEHFISQLLIRRLNASIDSIPTPASDGETWLLFLPEDEFHEIGLLMGHFLLRNAGYRVIYLGSNVPVSVLAPTVGKVNATNALFFMVRRDDAEIQEAYLREIAGISGLKRIFFATHEEFEPDSTFDSRLQRIRDPEELEKQIARIKKETKNG